MSLRMEGEAASRRMARREYETARISDMMMRAAVTTRRQPMQLPSGEDGIVPMAETRVIESEGTACAIDYEPEYVALVRCASEWHRILLAESSSCSSAPTSTPPTFERAVHAVLELTEQLLMEHNAALYTCWLWRRDAFRAWLANTAGTMDTEMGDTSSASTLMEQNVKDWCAMELIAVAKIAQSNQKNYQMCHHRQEMISMTLRTLKADVSAAETGRTSAYALDVFTAEAAFATYMLDLDAKNYHIWQHRLWLVTDFLGTFFAAAGDDRIIELEAELEFTRDKLIEDGQNNSAFMYRSVIAHSLRRAGHTTFVDEREANLFERILGTTRREQQRRLARNVAARRYFRASMRDTHPDAGAHYVLR